MRVKNPICNADSIDPSEDRFRVRDVLRWRIPRPSNMTLCRSKESPLDAKNFGGDLSVGTRHGTRSQLAMGGIVCSVFMNVPI